MKGFILNTILIYTLLSSILVAGIVTFDKYKREENNTPRKKLYVVNQTDDSISVYLTGKYTKYEKWKMKDRPDSYTLPSDTFTLPLDTSPYIYRNEVVKCQVAEYEIPHKYNKEIPFPSDMLIHIKHKHNEIIIDKNELYRLSGGEASDNAWTLYIVPSLFSLPNE